MDFDAYEFLQALFETPVSRDLPAEWVEEYEERAAILEFDGRLSRTRAETQARWEVKKRRKQNEKIGEKIQLNT